MTQLAISPVQWSSLKDIDEIEPLNETDSDCFAEVRDVLARHGKLERFGLALLHSHFPMGDDEVLLESTNKANRTLTLEPVKKSADLEKHVGTIWQLNQAGAEAMSWCRTFCKRGGIFVGHYEDHHKEE